MPAHPPFTFLGGSGSRVMPFGGNGTTSDRTASLGGRTRMVLPGRFMTIVYAENNDRHGYGFPQVVREPRPEGEEGTGRRWSRSRSVPNASQTGGTNNNNGRNNSEQEGEQQTQRRGSSWRERLRSIPTVPWIGIPSQGGRSRSIPTGTTADLPPPPPPPHQQQQEISPGQLEAGTAAVHNATTRPTTMTTS